MLARKLASVGLKVFLIVILVGGPTALVVSLVRSPRSPSVGPGPRKPAVSGRVIALDGAPLASALVRMGATVTRTDQHGDFRFSTRADALGSPQWVTVAHHGYLDRTRAAAPGSPVLIRLTPDDGRTISINFTGDVMFGRRFYDPNEDGNADDGLLRPGAGPGEHLRLLRDVQPLLGSSDITVANLESPLSSSPWFDPTPQGPARFHPTKEFAFASSPAAAVALRQAGVDLVDIGNNHLFDLLGRGVRETTRSLDDAGFRRGHGQFGGGLTEGEAWQPATVTVRGQSVAFLGCTTITGPKGVHLSPSDPRSYVASDGTKAGAAVCRSVQIARSVRAAKRTHDIVVLMIHGGVDYQRTPSPFVRRYTEIARRAGATLVIDGHPHVVGGFSWNGSSLAAWTMGNFVFDQTVWPTFESYLLTVDLRSGRVIRASVQPLIVDDYLPKGVVGELADHVVREAAGQDRGPFVIEDGAMEVDVNGRAASVSATRSVDGSGPQGSIYRIPPGTSVDGLTGGGTMQVGQDLLWVGDFENQDIDSYRPGEADLWEGGTWQIEPFAAFTGSLGARLQRTVANCTDAVLTPIHRIPVVPGQQLSVVGTARLSGAADLTAQVSWYRSTRGPSATQQTFAVPQGGAGDWTRFRIDLRVPRGRQELGLFIRLHPPATGRAIVDLDDLHVIAWSVRPDSGPLFEYTRVIGRGSLRLSRQFLPGAGPWARIGTLASMAGQHLQLSAAGTQPRPSVNPACPPAGGSGE